MKFAKKGAATAIAFLALTGLTGTRAYGAEDPPAWAYLATPPEYKLSPDDGAPRRVPDSTVTYTLSQLRDRFISPDWHPEEHRLMPDIVAKGRKPMVLACASCHRANGSGGPETASLAGLPAAYIVQQIADFKSGTRSTSVPNQGLQSVMIFLAENLTDTEAQTAAAYFSVLKPVSNVKVVETGTVPKTYVAGLVLATVGTGETEPIGQRIIEVPEDLERYEYRDSRARFIAYVPPGSLAKGKALVSTGGGKTVPCANCHGQDFKGTGNIPSIAGRSPSYIMRQLHDFQSGARAGLASPPMKAPVAKLTVEDMTAIAAYLVSQAP